jgi:uncharacterized membrane protein YedE/YeeE
MTQPAKVTAFLDFTGHWDPSLLFVMGGAVMVHAVLYRLIRRRTTPLFASVFSIPARREIDWRLVGGAALFGVGWGMGGFCPGPALTSLASGRMPVILFVASMLAGMMAYNIVENARARQEAAASRKAPVAA